MRLGDLDELYGIVKLHDIDIIRNNKTASWLLDQILFDIQESPTIDIDLENYDLKNQLEEERIKSESLRTACKSLKMHLEQAMGECDIYKEALQNWHEDG